MVTPTHGVSKGLCLNYFYNTAKIFVQNYIYVQDPRLNCVEAAKKSQAGPAPPHSALNKGQRTALMPTEQTRNCSCDSVPMWSLLSPYSTDDVACTSPFPGTCYFSLHARSVVLTLS